MAGQVTNLAGSLTDGRDPLVGAVVNWRPTDQLVDNAVSRVGPTATVTVVTGPIAFVALAAPQVARRLTRSGGVDLPTSALVGATMLTLSDLVALHAFPGTAIPVGAVTVCLGGL